MSTCPDFCYVDVFSARLESTRVSQSVSSHSDVVSTDIESSDTATESADLYMCSILDTED